MTSKKKQASCLNLHPGRRKKHGYSLFRIEEKGHYVAHRATKKYTPTRVLRKSKVQMRTEPFLKMSSISRLNFFLKVFAI